MKIKRLYAPWDMEYFGPAMMEKYGMEKYAPNNLHREEAAVFFGCYGRGSKIDVKSHIEYGIRKGKYNPIVIVWSGSDSTRLHEVGWFVDFLKQHKDRIFHIAHSHWIQTDLKHFGLDIIDKVIFPVDLKNFKFEGQKGTSVYHYGEQKVRPWYYGTDKIKELKKKWATPNIYITGPGVYRKEEVYEMYKDSFIGVRLTEHDNMALSCVEMGLMGRPSIFNGNIPCAIPYMENPYTYYEPRTRTQWIWQDESLMPKVANMILERRDLEPDKLLAEEMREFVYDDEEWLNTGYYE